MAEIRSKEEFYRLYNRGLIGNMLRNWDLGSWIHLHLAGHYPVDVIAARCTSVVGAPVNFDLAPDKALDWIYDTAARMKINPHSYQLSECAPDHINTLQGEVIRSSRYMHLHYCLHGHKRMRYTLNDPAISRHADGLQAQILLKQYMDGHSWDTLQYIWDRWPDATVEFCCYEKPVGVLQTNTLFWEARTHY